MDPFLLVLLCLLTASLLVGKRKKAKPFLAWVVALSEPKKKKRRRRKK